MSQLSTLQVVLRLARDYMLPRWRVLAIGMACAIGAAALTGVLATLLQPTINGLLANKADFKGLGYLPWALAGLAIARGLAMIAQGMLANRIGIDVVNAVQTEFVGKLLHADLARLRATHTGGFLSQVLNDALMIRDAATTGLLNYVQASLTVAALL